MKKITVLGAGSWGMALAVMLNENGFEVKVWDFDKNRANKLSKSRKFDLFKGLKIPSNIEISNNLADVLINADLVVFAIPSKAVRSLTENIQKKGIKIKNALSVVKGIENKTFFRMSELIKKNLKLKDDQVFVLTGPSHAEEVSKKMPTSVVIAGKDKKKLKILQKIFSNTYFRTYIIEDIVGSEIGGALKNIIAIAAGICDGLKLGANTKAALMTRGITEIARLGSKIGGRFDTFYGLSGIGDLIVTCTSGFSRNRYVGEQIGKGNKCKEILAKMKMVAEGVPTTKSVYFLAQKKKTQMPITEEIFKILYKNKSPRSAVVDLMTRKLRQEKEDVL
ncbi:NAD(P)H-dependent glycerol-3-phosphate dehydrogenase [bacterium]